MIWEVHEFTHLHIEDMMANITNARLTGVWSKLQVWQLLTGEFDRVLLVETDLVVTSALDPIFQSAFPAAVMRGAGDWDPATPRARDTYFSKAGQLAGGINGGMVLLEPSKREFDRMIAKFETFADQCA